MKKTAIMGFGNPCRSDDAVGCYVAEKLNYYFKENQNITVLDMGTGAFEVLFQLNGHEQIIIVDAVINTDEPDGTLFKLPADEINAAINNDPLVFLHSMKWDQALSYAKKIMVDKYPEDIVVYLIAVSNTNIEMEMSKVVQNAGDKVIEHIKALVC